MEKSGRRRNRELIGCDNKTIIKGEGRGTRGIAREGEKGGTHKCA